MPPVVAAVVGAVASAAATFSLSTFLVSTAISMALNAAGQALFGKKPKAPKSSYFERGIQDVIKSPIAAHRVIYGKMRVGGVMAFASTGGYKNKYLHLLVVLAGHEVEEIGDIWLDDYLLPELDVDGWVRTGRYANKIRIQKHLGAPDQAADSVMMAEIPAWTANHRLRGRAYMYVRMIYDQDIFPTGIPTPRALVKGKKVYDPRIDDTVWTDNWALCVHDFIGSPYGVNADADEFDESNIIAEANICDEDVDLGDGDSQKRYTLNGVIFTDEDPLENLEQLMTSAAGSVVWTRGQYHIFSAAYREPEITLTADDFIGEFKVTPYIPRQDLFNSVRGTFINPDNYWQGSDLPVVENAAYIEQDGGEPIPKDNELSFITDAIRGQRVNKIHLEKTRVGLSLQALCGYRAQNLAVMKTVQITLPQLNWNNKVFLVMDWQEEPTGGFRVLFQEEAEAVYDWNYGEATVIDPAPNSDFPDIYDVSNPTGVTVSTKSYLTETGTTISRILIEWTAPDDGFVTSGGSIEIQFKRSSEEDWEPSWFVNGDVVMASTPPVEDAVNYDIRIRSVSRLRVRPKDAFGDEAWQSIFGYTVGAAAAGAANQTDDQLITDDAFIYVDEGSIAADPIKFLDDGELTI